MLGDDGLAMERNCAEQDRYCSPIFVASATALGRTTDGSW